MGKEFNTKYLKEYEKLVDDYNENFSDYLPTTRNNLLNEFQNYCNALSIIDIGRAQEIIEYGKNWCKKWNRYQTTKDNTFVFGETLPGVQKELPMYVENEDLRDILFKATQSQQKPVEKESTDPLTPVSTKEYKKANKEWWNLQWKKHQLALDYLEAPDETLTTSKADIKTERADRKNGLTNSEKYSLANRAANKVIENAKKYKNLHYPFETIFFVMRFRLDHPNNKKGKLIEEIRELDDCPSSLKGRPKEKLKPEIRWINKIDDKADKE